MFYSVLAVFKLIVGPLRNLTACKSQAFKIAGQNIMATPESVETSVLFEPLHDTLILMSYDLEAISLGAILGSGCTNLI